jgi:hypothetical protein
VSPIAAPSHVGAATVGVSRDLSPSHTKRTVQRARGSSPPLVFIGEEIVARGFGTVVERDVDVSALDASREQGAQERGAAAADDAATMRSDVDTENDVSGAIEVAA